jgi:hypothetical protein
MLGCANARLVSTCTLERMFRVEKMGGIRRLVSRGPSGASLRRYLAIFATSISYSLSHQWLYATLFIKY